MKTKELADWLGVAPSTIRTWASSEFHRYLSEAAQGGDGRTRSFMDLDARILAFILTLKNEGVPPEEIHASLAQLQSENWADLPSMPPAPPGSGPIPMVPREAAETAVSTQRAALMREIAILQERVETLEDILEAQRKQHSLDLAKERQDRELERQERESERNQLQGELLRAKEDLGELRGKLHALTGERQLWLRGIIVVAIVAAVLLAVVVLVLLNLAGVGVG